MTSRPLHKTELKLISKVGGRRRFSRNKKSKFDRDRCMDILHDVAARPENKNLSIYQIFDEAAREIIATMLERKPDDEQYRKSHLEAVRKQLQRDQEESDDNYLFAVDNEMEIYETELKIYRDHDPDDGPSGPPPRPYDEALEDRIKHAAEDYRTLPQGFTHSAMVGHSITLKDKQPVRKRRLKGRI